MTEPERSQNRRKKGMLFLVISPLSHETNAAAGDVFSSLTMNRWSGGKGKSVVGYLFLILLVLDVVMVRCLLPKKREGNSLFSCLIAGDCVVSVVVCVVKCIL